MDTFTLGVPRWRVWWVFAGNPLLRSVDRVEAAVFTLAILVCLAAAPVAAAVGPAVHDSWARTYAQQAQDRHALDAIVVGTADSPGSTKVITVRGGRPTESHTSETPRRDQGSRSATASTSGSTTSAVRSRRRRQSHTLIATSTEAFSRSRPPLTRSGC
jgi:hypothetical protein